MNTLHTPLRPTHPRPAGASPASCGRRSVPGHGARMLGAVRLSVTGSVIFLACIATLASLHAGGEAGNGEKPRAGKNKSTGTVPVKPATEKKTDPLLPFLQMPQQKAGRAEVEASSLAPALKKKLIAGEPLSLAEIEALAPAKLQPELLIKCLRTSGGSYELLTKDIDRLRAAGLPDSVLDSLLTTRHRRVPLLYPSLYYWPGLHHYDDWHHSDHHYGSMHIGGHDHH